VTLQAMRNQSLTRKKKKKMKKEVPIVKDLLRI
jgi:hypothetical protein